MGVERFAGVVVAFVFFALVVVDVVIIFFVRFASCRSQDVVQLNAAESRGGAPWHTVRKHPATHKPRRRDLIFFFKVFYFYATPLNCTRNHTRGTKNK